MEYIPCDAAEKKTGAEREPEIGRGDRALIGPKEMQGPVQAADARYLLHEPGAVDTHPLRPFLDEIQGRQRLVVELAQGLDAVLDLGAEGPQRPVAPVL